MRTAWLSLGPCQERGSSRRWFLAILEIYVIKSVMLYSSRDKVDLEMESEITSVDANSYSGFKIVDSAVVKRVMDELDTLGEFEDEGSNKESNRFVSYDTYISQPLLVW
jgi:hypothetical protein